MPINRIQKFSRFLKSNISAKKSFLLLILLVSFAAKGQQKTICISIDDLPTVSYGSSELDEEITSKLMATIGTYKIPVIGFVNENKLYSHGKLIKEKVELLESWLKNGCDLGNHTFSHLDYNKVDSAVFYDDVLKGEKITKTLLEKYGKKMQYFRHPYLHSGSDSISFNALTTFLLNHGYTISPVTIDNDDYLFAKAYADAYKAGDKTQMSTLGEVYVSYMEEKLLYFESKSKEVFNTLIPQTLLVHASLLNADYLDDLASVYLKHGYSFVKQEEVFKHQAYHTEMKSYTPYGYSWIFRWGLSTGFGKEIFQGDVETPKDLLD